MSRAKTGKIFILTLLFMNLICVPSSIQAYYGGIWGPGGLSGSLYGLSDILAGRLYGWYGGNGLYGLGGFSDYGFYGNPILSGRGFYGGLAPSLGLSAPFGLSGLFSTSPNAGFSWASSFRPAVGGLGVAAAPYLGALRSSLILTGGGGGGGVVSLDPTGYWRGPWVSSVSLQSGIMSLNLAYNPLSSTITGSAGLLINRLIPTSIPVIGPYTGTIFTLTGTYRDPLTLITYYEELICTIVSAISITGDYLISDPLSGASDSGTFTLALTSTVPLV
ncbi:MAG: hypothetical protein ACMUIA_09655 [bacterium]